MNRLAFSVAMAAALGAVGMGLWLVASSGDEVKAATASQSALIGKDARAPAPAPRLGGSAPGSFADAARLLELGVAGDLSLDMHTRSALDLLLASLGPHATPADLLRLEDALRRSMPDEAATQAMALVRRYDGYHRAADAQAASQQPPTTAEEMKVLLDKTVALRRQHFDEATARALFGAEEEQTRLDMAIHAVQADPKLPAQDKATQIAALQERAPRDLPGLQAPVSAALADMDTRVAALRQQGASPEQIDQLRRRYLGDDAAQSLSDTETQAAHWQSRYQAFAQQKKAIVAAAAPDMAAQIDTALRQHFTEEELAAARAYDRNRTP
ncbi:MAG: lipase secretion chaperone [Rhizobacter sp.]